MKDQLALITSMLPNPKNIGFVLNQLQEASLLQHSSEFEGSDLRIDFIKKGWFTNKTHTIRICKVYVGNSVAELTNEDGEMIFKVIAKDGDSFKVIGASESQIAQSLKSSSDLMKKLKELFTPDYDESLGY